MDIQKNIYFGYPKYLFWISEIIILDIQNNAEQVFYFGYPKRILDIQNNYF